MITLPMKMNRPVPTGTLLILRQPENGGPVSAHWKGEEVGRFPMAISRLLNVYGEAHVEVTDDTDGTTDATWVRGDLGRYRKVTA